MPLYNNILLSRKSDSKAGEQNVPSDNKSTSVASSSMKLLQDHLMSKKRTKLQLQPNQKPANKFSSTSSTFKSFENNWDPLDEYDPMVPNSYEVLKAEYIKAEEQRLLARKSGNKIDPKILDVLDKLDGEDYSFGETRGTSIAPPPSLSSSIIGNSSDTGSINYKTLTQTNQSSGEKLDGATAAAKIMSKMGYKAGQGLGRDEQGISAPLEVEKCGLNAGRIIQPIKPDNLATITVDQTQRDPLATQVLLLQNMVGPGEVDDDLEAETKEECKKYGEVIKCLIYEIPNKRVPDHEAVRIFVQFQKVESAIKAANDLNGRYFGGRVVRASYYNVNKFNKYELGP